MPTQYHKLGESDDYDKAVEASIGEYSRPCMASAWLVRRLPLNAVRRNMKRKKHQNVREKSNCTELDIVYDDHLHADNMGKREGGTKTQERKGNQEERWKHMKEMQGKAT